MINKTGLLFGFLVIVLIGCRENERAIPLNLSETKLVLWAELAANQPAVVTLTKTADDPSLPIIFEEQLVKDATVILMANNDLAIDTLLFNEGKYYSKEPVKDATDYSIEVHKAGFSSITTDAIQVPPAVAFIDSTAVLSTDPDCRGTNSSKYFNLKWSIDTTKTQYYLVQNYGNCRNYEFKDFQYDCAFGSTYRVGEYFRDNCFSTDVVAITLSDIQRSNDLLDNANLHVISESRYLFEQSLQDIDAFAEGFAEPRITYSNVQNGYGIIFAIRTYEFLF